VRDRNERLMRHVVYESTDDISTRDCIAYAVGAYDKKAVITDVVYSLCYECRENFCKINFIFLKLARILIFSYVALCDLDIN